VGGLWDIDSPPSTVYESAHLISSQRTTEFADRLKSVFGYTPSRTSRQAFDEWRVRSRS
jgi:hypothetical protein